MPLHNASLEQIGIRLGHVAPMARPSGNLLPLLHEIRHALTLLHESGTTTTLDLAALPFGPGDREALLGFLGQGEVKAQINALGKTDVYESRFPGVWVLSYLSPDGTEIGLQLEIGCTPRLLSTPRDDIADSLSAFANQLDTYEEPS